MNLRTSPSTNPDSLLPIAMRITASLPVGFDPLGSNSKSTFPNLNQQVINDENLVFDAETHTFQEVSKKFKVKKYDSKVVRRKRYALQSSAAKLLPKESVSRCLRFVQKAGDGVLVFKSKKHESASYSGLQVCSSVWTCPVCSAKISERRRKEVHSAIKQHEENGGEVILCTLTVKHSLDDELKSLLKGQKKALSRFTGTNRTRKILKAAGHIGSIRAFELTYSDNAAWHPHHHVLLFLDAGVDKKQLEEDLFDQWKNACRLAKLKEPNREHGLRIDGGSKASNYIAKWGLDYEITKGISKKSNKGRSPFDLLKDFSKGDKQAGALFIEYAGAVKGSAQLFWSRGLKDLFNIEELNDKELEGKDEDDAELVGRLEVFEWKLIVKNNLRCTVLEIAEEVGWSGIRQLLDELIAKDEEIERKLY